MPNKKFQSSFKHSIFRIYDKLSKKKSREEPKPENKANARNRITSWAVFIPTIIVLLFSLSSAIFPALITRSFSPIQGLVTGQDYVNPFEPGILAAPLIIVNLIVLGIGILYYKKKIPILARIINFISNFDLSKKRALIILGIILVIFAAATAGQLSSEETFDDYKDVKDATKYWRISNFVIIFEPHVKYLLLSTSVNVFGNIRVMPFIASIALLALTYFFTVEITKNRFAGIVSTLILVQSNVFLSYDTTATYDNFWILLYLFSLYLIYKKWPPSPASYIFSILSKTLTLTFLPMSLYFITRSDISRKSKIFSLGSYGAVILALVAAFALHTNLVGSAVGFDENDFWKGFTALAMQMRFDYVILIFLLPLTVMLFFASRKGTLHADSIMIFILTILLTAPFLIGFTAQTNQPYRFVSLSVFFAVGVGVLLSKRTSVKVELSSKS